ncbi:MAG TPA: nucleotidyltransferase family protein, partial [Thermoanaerobaculia bacterium]|nr:nucleotidyltransferase family protein [Thermoanaerobaculia bacterium]
MSALREACEALARGVAGPAGAGLPARAALNGDGAAFRQACQVHGVAPLLHLRLTGQGAGDGAAPEDLAAWLAHQYRQNRERIARMLGELGEVLALFDREGVPLMPMKGAVLLPLHYDDPGARPMNDLDLLLPPEHWEAGHELLGRLGYERTFE